MAGSDLAPPRRHAIQIRHLCALSIVLFEVIFILWFFPYLPMIDLPQHMLTAKILTHYADPETAYSHFFTKEWPWNPYSSYFWFAILLEPVLGVHAATRLYLALGLVLTPLSFWCWLRTATPGRDAQVIPSTLLLFSLFFYIGLINFLFSVPFFFFALAFGWKLMEGRRSWRMEAGLALSLLLAYFSHIVTFVVALLVIGGHWLMFFRNGSVALLLRDAAPAIGASLIYVLTRAREDVPGMTWLYDPFGSRAAALLMPLNIFNDPFGQTWTYFAEMVGLWIGFLVLTGWGLFGTGRDRRSRSGTPAGYATAGMLVAAVLFLPSKLGGLGIGLRVSYMALFALLAVIPPAWDDRRSLRVLMVVVCALGPVTVGYRLWHFQAEMAQLEAIVAAMPPRQIVLPVVTEGHSQYFRTYPFHHAATWYNYRKGGTNPYTLARLRHFPVREREQFIPNPMGEWRAGSFKYDLHQEGVNYFLVRTKRADIISDLQAHVPLAARVGDWMVFGPNAAKSGAGSDGRGSAGRIP